jgi:hypothetical protein
VPWRAAASAPLPGETTGSPQAETDTEWSDGRVINLGGDQAYGINNAEQVVGQSGFYAAEWTGGNVINPGACRIRRVA